MKFPDPGGQGMKPTGIKRRKFHSGPGIRSDPPHSSLGTKSLFRQGNVFAEYFDSPFEKTGLILYGKRGYVILNSAESGLHASIFISNGIVEEDFSLPSMPGGGCYDGIMRIGFRILLS